MESDYFELCGNYLNALNISNEIKKSISFEEFAKKNPSYYLKYPAIFSEIFEIKKSTEVDLLCIAGFLYYRSMISTDQLYDEKLDKNSKFYTFLPVVISVCQEESTKILTHLFGLKSDFWTYWNLRKFEFLTAMQIEKKIRLKKKPFDITTYYELAEKKSAMGKVAIDSLHMLSEQKHSKEYNLLLKSHKYFSIGLQLSDDFQDFKEDLKSNQVNWLFNELQNDLSKEGKNIIEYDAATLNKFIYIKDVANKALSLAIEFYKKAINCLSFIEKKTGTFEKIIQEKITEVETTIEQIKEYMAILNKKIELFSCKKVIYQKIDPLISSGDNLYSFLLKLANYLIDQANTDFAELKHVMYLSQREGFNNKHSVHVGDVFQRAILLDVLCDINKEFDFKSFNLMAKKETSYILSQRLKRGVGGWSYFPTAKEIAPDTDDLGQILQCLVRTNNESAIKKHILPLLEILFTNNYDNKSGGIETWIVPKSNQTKLEEIQNHFNSTKWGKGPDNEVMANLLYGLSLAKITKYNEHITKGITFLLNTQNSEGYWHSRWYYGNYYGTYTCLRLFKRYRVENNQIKKAIYYIIDTQNHDGGWQNGEKESSVLATSFALLSLNLYHFDPRATEAVKKGVSFLMAKFSLNENTYPSEPFIIPKAGHPYKSRTITVGYAIKAILASRDTITAYE